MENRAPLGGGADRLRVAEATVLCMQLAGAPAYTRGIGAIEEAQFLFDYNTEMTEVILAHDGAVDGYDRGTVTAFSGDPVGRADHPEQACAAAVVMRDRLLLRWGGDGRLQLCCGLSTGKVAVGDMGSRHRAQLSVAGEALRLAERLIKVEHSLGAAIVATQDTSERISGGFVVQELDRITYPGRGAPVAVYEVVGRQGSLDAATAAALERYQRGLDHYRKREWSAAMDCFQQAGTDDIGYGFGRRYATRCWLRMQVPEVEALTRLTEAKIRELLRRVDVRDLLEALREMDADLREILLGQMSQRVRQFVEEEIEAVQLTAYSREAIAAKYRRIADIAAELAQEAGAQAAQCGDQG
ncbi:MAG: FliG C-terminal domain-containing protein [Candidatus Latescibacterota bacterium]